MKKGSEEVIRDLRRKLREARIGEGILWGIIISDGWDFDGSRERVMESLGISVREYNYLRRMFPNHFKE